MKKDFRFLLAGLIVLLSTVACSNSSNAAAPSESASQVPNASGSENLSEIARLAVGTLKLEGTDQAVTSEQANQLLTLWQAYQTLSASDTTAAAELEAVVNQIQNAMTSQQIQAIQAMQLTSQSVVETMQSLTIDASTATTTSGTETISSGQMSAGGGPGGDGGLTGGGPADGGMAPLSENDTPITDSYLDAFRITPYN